MRKNDIFAHDHGEVSEWSNEQSWKDCSRGNRLEGSNPSLSATWDLGIIPDGLFYFDQPFFIDCLIVMVEHTMDQCKKLWS